MADLIDREKLMPILDAHIADMREKYGDNRLCNMAISLVQNQRDFISTVPSVDAERPKGEWVDTGFFTSNKTPIFECSVCHKEVYDYYIKCHNFCLHCGADMRSHQKSLCDQNEKENDEDAELQQLYARR